MLMALNNAKRVDKTGQNPKHMSPRNKHEDYFAMIMHDDVNKKAEDILGGFGLTVLAEVGEGSSLDQNPRNAMSIFGHPLVKEDYKRNKSIPLRFSFGNERHQNCLETFFGYGWRGSDQNARSHERIFYDFDTLGGNSGSPVLSRQEKKPHYYVKGIHIAGEEYPKFNKQTNKHGIVTNEAQQLRNIIQDLKKC